MKLNPDMPIKMLIPIENSFGLMRELIDFPRYAVIIAIIPRPSPIKHPFNVSISFDPKMINFGIWINPMAIAKVPR